MTRTVRFALTLLWVALSLCAAACTLSCAQRPLPVIPPDEVLYESGMLRLPGAVFVFDGRVFEDQAQVPPGRLVGIVVNKQAFIFLSGGPDRNLSEDGSRRALGSFLTSRQGRPGDGVRTTDRRRLSRWLFAGPGANAEPTTPAPTLGTGVSLEWPSADSASGKTDSQSIKITNQSKRWIAAYNANAMDVAPALIQPRGSPIEFDYVDALQESNPLLVVKVLETDEANVELGCAHRLVTLGSVARALPLLDPSKQSIVNTVNPTWIESVRAAAQENEDLFLRLNALELALLSVDAMAELVGDIAPACVDALVNAHFAALKPVIAGILSDTNEQAQDKVGVDAANDLVSEVLGCVAEAACIAGSAATGAIVGGVSGTPAGPPGEVAGAATGTAGGGLAGTVVCTLLEYTVTLLLTGVWVVDEIGIGGLDAVTKPAISDTTRKCENPVPPNVIDDSVIRVRFDHSTGSIQELTWKNGSNTQLLDTYWVGQHKQGLGRIGSETGTAVGSFESTTSTIRLSYVNPAYRSKELSLSWDATAGIEMVVLVDSDGGLNEGSTWRPGGRNDRRDRIKIISADQLEKIIVYSYPGPYTVLYSGQILGAGIWDDSADEVFGYAFEEPVSATVANGASADGPHYGVPAGSFSIHFAVKRGKEFWSWVSQFRQQQ